MAERGLPRQSIAWPKRLAVAGLTLLLAACSTVVPRGAPPATTAPIAKPTAPQGNLPQDAARNRVALLVPLTGPNAAVGQSIADAAMLAVADTGGKGVRVTTYDTGGGALAAAQRALIEGNRLFLGPLLADDVRAIASAARGAGVPVIAFSNDASIAGDGVYVLGLSPAQSINRVVRYAKSRGLTRFAGLVPAGLYGRNAQGILIRAAEEAGGSVVSLQTYDRSVKSLATAVAGIKGDYDAVLIADVGRIAIQAAPLVRKANPSAQLLGPDLWSTDRTINASPALAGAWYASFSDGLYDQLAAKFRARYGRAPYRLASLGYDSVLLTVRVASDWKVGDRFPVGKLTDAGGFSGIDGAFRFGRDGIAERALEVHEVGQGARTVSPASRSFAE
ncbi:penicillin-binding protein activator [Sphingomonas naphthae]|uniref:Penicillin-binding protein activator n=1 Tax=Sphingomonas naphthae TaxID=1813468 RepID=A0ABY7TPH9_9SPHN|nr:penicillin-binding protein activator [Sphingomonas naphthae]WCT75142.1 penicillin-binding protein activator [Sphingomonas naphthae]